MSDIAPSVIGNVLKKYLQRLPEPLIVFALYHEFLRVAKQSPGSQPVDSKVAAAAPPTAPTAPTPAAQTEEAAVQEYKDLVKKLPRHYLHTLVFLMHHLFKVS